MKDKQILEIEKVINYTFQNKALLRQAFTRKSYSDEQKKFGKSIANNELLEFYGDSVLDRILVNWLMKNYANTNVNGVFVSEYSEGEFTNARSNLVSSQILSSRIDFLGLADYLVMGEGDKVKNVQDETSVKEDLFEAIVCAIALDSKSDNKILEEVIIDVLLMPNDYIGKDFKTISINIINDLHEYCQKQNLETPVYQMYDDCFSRLRKFRCEVSVEGFAEIGNAEGKNKEDAKRQAARKLLTRLKQKFDSEDLFKGITLENSINRLQELAQIEIINFPEYLEEKISGGWKLTCKVQDIVPYSNAIAISIKEAKKAAAFEMLQIIIDEIKNNNITKQYNENDYQAYED